MKSSDPAHDPTEHQTAATTGPGVQGATARAPVAGYREDVVLGRGGMGEVVLAIDERIGREVALKRMRGDASPRLTARFLREARIQALLDHPSIVPVHAIGEDADGRPYFTMKRLAGKTLAEVLRDAPLQRLLRAFVDVCLAVELAHRRGVIHRDLKPSNIMLGEYGEVYVLDWGVARLADEAEPELADTARGEGTEAGTLLGTPGYMAPEQARGEPVTEYADSYSLGCILSEILTRDPQAEAPPELDLLCTAALAANPDHRPSARALADRIQQYLDGDRDLERRRVLAGEAFARARELLAAGDRGGAMQHAGRALALDPQSASAAQLVSQLMIEPPEQLPAELDAHLKTVDAAYMRVQWRNVALLYGLFFPFLPVLLWQGVEQGWVIATAYLALAGMLAWALRWRTAGTPHLAPWLAGGVIAMVLATRVFGDFILVPGMLCIQLYGYLSYPTLMARPVQLIALAVGTFALPLVLELAGVIDRTWAIIEGRLVIDPAAISYGGAATAILLLAGHLALFVGAGLFGWSLARARRDAQRKVEIQAWHLRKLIPAEP